MRVVEPRAVRWTRDEYYRMAEVGFFLGRKVELIKGEVIEMSPQDSGHTTAVSLLDYLFKAAFPRGWVVRIQSPLALGAESDPEPDIAVVKGSPRDFVRSQPSTAALVIEVASSSLEYDRTSKASLYAEAGIQDYWIVDLIKRRLEVYRNRREDETPSLGFGYADRMVLEAGESVSPLALPEARLLVADMLP